LPSLNALAQEKSLYLRQHAEQPVAWLPFSREVFERARAEEKPLFISIGYSACHWCHVMARESFEDEEIAAILNENFIPVKVDREEHPEVDAVYLLACEILRGQAGWPLTVLALPDGWPFFVATYLPKEGRGLRLGLKELLVAVQRTWQLDRQKILATAEEIEHALKQIRFANPAPFDSQAVCEKAFRELSENFDEQFGGFGKGPKFPLPLRLLFLLRLGQASGKGQALEMVRKTLLKMRFSGLFDQIGFGFHRYTIDRAWKIPHFEKMLYDQGLLLYLYAEAASLFGEALFGRVAEEIVIYLRERLLEAERGYFYTAESAESEGEEGLFYTWSLEELEEVLFREELALLTDYFDLRPEGNYLEEATGRPCGRNVLHPVKFPWELGESFEEKLVPILQKLKHEREKRPAPPRDEKILTDWNALVIAGLARAGSLLGEKSFVEMAERAFSSLWEEARPAGRLLHIPGEERLPALLEDYVFLSWAGVELAQATKDTSYRQKAETLLEEASELFRHPSGLYQQVGVDQGPFLIPYFSLFEGALPSGNGLLAYLLKLLGQEDSAERLLFHVGGHLRENPSAFPSFLLALLI